MNITSHITEALLSKAFEAFLEDAEKEWKEILAREVQLLETRLNNLRISVEMQQAMWLKSGLTFLQLGNTDEALKEFVRAEASDKRSAVAKFYLGLVLARQGQTELAKDRLRDSILINPFLVLLELKKNNQLPTNCESNLIPVSNTWLQHLNSANSIKLVDPQRLRGEFGAITHLSVSGGIPIVSWRLESEFGEDDDGKRIVNCIDISTGKILWSFNTVKRKLCFATPRFVILEIEGQNIYELRSTLNGQPEGEMSAQYFETVFCPSYSQLNQLQEFQRSNCFMSTSNNISKHKEKTEKLIRSRMGFFENLFKSIPDYKYTDRKLVTDLFDLGLYSIEISNSWKEDSKVTGFHKGVVLSKRFISSNAKIQRLK